ELIVMFGTPRTLKVATLQSIAEAGAAAMTLQNSAAKPNTGKKVPYLRPASTCVFICESSCRGVFRCQRIISNRCQCHEGRKFATLCFPDAGKKSNTVHSGDLLNRIDPESRAG